MITTYERIILWCGGVLCGNNRVHYPLPLVFEERPDTQKLQATIARMRTELHQVQATQSTAPATEKVTHSP
jgi:hypothetical protein